MQEKMIIVTTPSTKDSIEIPNLARRRVGKYIEHEWTREYKLEQQLRHLLGVIEDYRMGLATPEQLDKIIEEATDEINKP